nr:VOC family protein [uncultured Dyadobacter sp.]
MKSSLPGPTIISPVSRHLVVSDVAASIAFYVDQLGFESVETLGTAIPFPAVALGAARIYFHTTDGAVDSTGPLRPVGSAMIFFEINDVMGFYEIFQKKGLTPTKPERVNWIKMALFEVSDPDGHRLWFGKSFHDDDPEQIHTPPGEGQLRQVMPAFPCADVPAAVMFYQQVMGFSVNYQQHDLGVMDRDSIRLLLVAKTQHEPGPCSCCVYIRNADELYQELKAKGANLPKEPVSQPWGLREFDTIDPDGNRITLAQTFE